MALYSEQCHRPHLAFYNKHFHHDPASSMLLRPSQKLSVKLKSGSLTTLPSHENPFADWSTNGFIVQRMHYVLVSNTASLYSVFMRGKGITNANSFLEQFHRELRAVMEADGLLSIYSQRIQPHLDTVQFAKALNRSVTGSMNDIIRCARYSIEAQDEGLIEVSRSLNEMPLSMLKHEGRDYGQPKSVMIALAS